MKGAPVMPKEEEFVNSTEQQGTGAGTKDATAWSSKEECVCGTEQIERRNYAAMKDAPKLFKVEDFVFSTEPQDQPAVMMDALVGGGKGGFAGSIGMSKIHQ